MFGQPFVTIGLLFPSVGQGIFFGDVAFALAPLAVEPRHIALRAVGDALSSTVGALNHTISRIIWVYAVSRINHSASPSLGD
jgi:hypothetical protein